MEFVKATKVSIQVLSCNEEHVKVNWIREAITEEKQLICGHLPVGGGLTNSIPFGVIFRSSTGTFFFYRNTC